MRRIVLIVAGLVAAALLVRAVSGDGSKPYEVRAIFDNASFAATGEEVKVAGASVGTIDAIGVTADNKAALTLKISNSAFVPFHADAQCSIRSEGLLAVKFVECDPGTAASPELASITTGDGAGTHLLPVQRTSTPVDLDLVLDTYRQPAGQQLAILLSEFGAGLAARGSDLNAIVHRADPALRETDDVLKILGNQNQQLVQFAEDADSVVSALASRQHELAGFVSGAAGTAQATAERSTQIAQSLERLPGFLHELRPTLNELGDITAQATPVLSQFHQAGHDLSRTVSQLQPLARNGIPAFQGLGSLGQSGGPNLTRSQPLVENLKALGQPLRPVANKLAKVTKSLKKNKAREHLLQLIFGAANASNGFDSVGHYARMELLSGACSEYTPKGYFGCDAQWGPTGESAGPVAASAKAHAASAHKARSRKPSIKATSSLLGFLLGGQQ